jgi:Ni/Co efflux regulator RcnB
MHKIRISVLLAAIALATPVAQAQSFSPAPTASAHRGHHSHTGKTERAKRPRKSTGLNGEVRCKDDSFSKKNHSNGRCSGHGGVR